MRQDGDRDLYPRVWLHRTLCIERKRILRRQQPRLGEEGDKPERFPFRRCRDQRHAVGEQLGVAAELVDEEAADEGGVASIDHRLGADEACDDASTVNVADEHHRHVRRAGKAHIGDVVGAEIDL